MPAFRTRLKQDPKAIQRTRSRMQAADPTQFTLTDPADEQRFQYRWVNRKDSNLHAAINRDGFTPVKKSEVVILVSFGDQTTNDVICGDLILCKRSREIMLSEKADAIDYLTNNLNSEYNGLTEQAAGNGGFRDVTSRLKSVSIQDGVPGEQEESVIGGV